MPCESLRQVCSASLKSLWSKDGLCLFIFSYRSSTGMIVPKKTLWESCAVCWLASEIRQRFKRQVYLHFNTQTSDISAAFWKKNIVFVENDKNQWGSEDGWHSDYVCGKSLQMCILASEWSHSTSELELYIFTKWKETLS